VSTRIDDPSDSQRLLLLVRLYQHRPQRHHTPTENYVTEAFAVILSTDRELLEAFFRQVAQEHVPDKVCIDTQVAWEKGVFDILVTGEDFYYAIESKFSAPFATGTDGQSGDQLERYAAELARRPESRKGIISVTLRNPPAIKLPVSLFTTRWIDVIQWCRDIKTSPGYSTAAEFLKGGLSNC
jgi:hypothetical protein